MPTSADASPSPKKARRSPPASSGSKSRSSPGVKGSATRPAVPSWPEIMKRKTQFERDCARDSLTSQLPEDLRKIVWELIVNPAKIQGACSLISRSVLAEAPVVKKKRGVKAVDDAAAEHWDIDKNSQIPKYWLWEVVRLLSGDGTIAEAFISKYDKKDRGFVRKLVEAMTGLRSTYKVLDQMKQK
eukprot:8106945-Pyramimonas_sp.AAC.1